MILSDYHKPVLKTEVTDLLQVKKGHFYLDATVGGGGHATEIIKNGGIVFGLDADPDALKYLRVMYPREIEEGNLILINCNFGELDKYLDPKIRGRISGAVFDLGLSTNQIDKSGRGFTYKGTEDLDMRFDPKQSLKAETIINKYSKGELYEIFSKNAEELNSGPIADAVVRARSLEGGIKTNAQLNRIILEVLDRKNEGGKDRVLARIYQALRMEVNSEMVNLSLGLKAAIDFLRTGGRIAVISYHSLEDRIVKNIFSEYEKAGIVEPVTGKTLRPGYRETRINRRSRSAKLRVAGKI